MTTEAAREAALRAAADYLAILRRPLPPEGSPEDLAQQEELERLYYLADKRELERLLAEQRKYLERRGPR